MDSAPSEIQQTLVSIRNALALQKRNAEVGTTKARIYNMCHPSPSLWSQLWQIQFSKALVVLFRELMRFPVKFRQLLVDGFQNNLRLGFCGAHVTGQIEVESALLDFFH